VEAQRAAARLGRGGGSPEPGVAQAMEQHFRRGLTLRMQRIKGNSPRGSSNVEGDRSRARDGGGLAPTFGDINDELQKSAGDDIRLHGGGATRRRAMLCWLGTARSPMERR
jgi:hypothetical protein